MRYVYYYVTADATVERVCKKSCWLMSMRNYHEIKKKTVSQNIWHRWKERHGRDYDDPDKHNIKLCIYRETWAGWCYYFNITDVVFVWGYNSLQFCKKNNFVQFEF